MSKKHIAIIFILTFSVIFIFISIFFYKSVLTDRIIPKTLTSKLQRANRGDIITSDGFTIASSSKFFKAVVDVRNIDPKKLDLFIKLYSLYSGDDIKKIRKKITNAKSEIILSNSINARTAAHLKELSNKLYRHGVFIEFEDKNSNSIIKGLDIIEDRQNRNYIAKKSLSPILGYMQRDNIHLKPIKGIEKYYDQYLKPNKDAKFIGQRDANNNLIMYKNSQISYKEDGYNLHLNISLKLQSELENIIDKEHKRINAKEIIAAIMNSKSGEILAIASSLRYDPAYIKKNEISYLNPSITEYAYEVGSVFKPFIFAIALKENKLNPLELINTENGKMKLGRHLIKDVHGFNFLSAQDVIIQSSNIGMAKIGLRLNPLKLYEGLRKFGFGEKTGIDLIYEKRGVLPSISKLNNTTIRANLSYGYGLNATFIQLLNAYNSFNNKGIAPFPHIGKYIEKNKEKFDLNFGKKDMISQEIAKIMKRILIQTVKKGTAKEAFIQGLEIGGKTGTAHIFSNKNDKYEDNYNGSFFGFANDKTNNYTIGIVAIEPKAKGQYFGSRAALPSFKQAVQLLIKENYLKPDN